MGKGAKGVLGGTGSYSFLRLLWDIRGIIKVVEGLPNLLRVFREGLA